MIVQPLAGSGADVLLGALAADPDLGKVMAIGLGGRGTGLGRDVAFRLLPFTDVDARELIALRAYTVQWPGRGIRSLPGRPFGTGAQPGAAPSVISNGSGCGSGTAA